MDLKAHEELYDLIVIGGGINGAAIARDAALRKLKVVLLEKNDFGSGASSNTSKLVHGGLRYLERFQFSLVRESLKERALLLKNAPHLVRPLPFLLPVYSEDPHSLWKINLGLFLYDCLAPNKDLPKHRRLSPAGILQQVSGLRDHGLQGGCSYYDAQMMDNRIVIENILSAEREGALVYNHRQVTGLIKEKNEIQGVAFLDSLTGEKGELQGKVIVNATGAWSTMIGEMEPNIEHCCLTPTKGVHLVIPKIVSDTALLLRAPQDGRVFFILPWDKFNLVGTTDTLYQGSPDQLVVDAGDRHYLLDALNAYFPGKQITESSIIASFVGLRPLVSPEVTRSPSDILREHVIQVSKGGLITILGGKYTTHRLIAEEVVDTVVIKQKSQNAFLPCTTAIKLFPGASGRYSLEEVQEKLENAGLSDELTFHLLNTYGTASLDILEIMLLNRDEAEPICECCPHVFAEVTYGFKNEHLKTIGDWFLRNPVFTYSTSLAAEWTERISKKLALLQRLG